MISTAVWVQGSFAASSSSAADDVFTSAGFAWSGFAVAALVHTGERE